MGFSDVTFKIEITAFSVVSLMSMASISPGLASAAFAVPPIQNEVQRFVADDAAAGDFHVGAVTVNGGTAKIARPVCLTIDKQSRVKG